MSIDGYKRVMLSLLEARRMVGGYLTDIEEEQFAEKLDEEHRGITDDEQEELSAWIEEQLKERGL